MRPTRHVLFQGDVRDSQTVNWTDVQRGFLYADGCFETLRWTAGNVPYLALHVGRLRAALEGHGILVPPSLDLGALAASLDMWRKTWEFQGDARIRLTAWRAGGGTYTPESEDAAWMATAEPVEGEGYTLPSKGLDIDIYQDLVKHPSPLSKFKNVAATLYVQAARHAKARGWGDALVLNADQKIIESTRSNVFVVSNGVLFTPRLEDGCVAGIMRAVVIRVALENGMKVYECTLTPQALLQADEMFLTNAVRGIEWVARYKTKRYFHAVAEKLASWIQADTVRVADEDPHAEHEASAS